MTKDEIKQLIRDEIMRYNVFYPQKIIGDKKASQILGISANTLTKRRYNGYYIEGVHWYKENTKLKRGNIIWNTSALLKERDRNENKSN